MESDQSTFSLSGQTARDALTARAGPPTGRYGEILGEGGVLRFPKATSIVGGWGRQV